MADSCIMKQLREKHVSAEISKCLWSPKMDLLAIANVQGQVVLHRLSWQQVWVLNPPTENMKVTSLAWRLDSKVLAVGYSSGKVLLVNIEDSSTVHELDLKEEVTAISWNKYLSVNQDPAAKSEKQQHPWASYMYPLPPLSKSFGEGTTRVQSDVWQEPRLLRDQTDLSVLCVGTTGGALHLYAFGLFHVASVDVAGKVPGAGRILDITSSPALDLFSLVLEKEEEGARHLAQVSLEMSVLSARHAELHSLAQKYGQIYSLMTYISHTLRLVEEAWEGALVEMDAKLAAHAASLPEEGGVSADFLDLLVWGHASAEFEIFLTNRLTEKSLKKLRHSVDLCYSSMQRLVVRHLQQVGVTLVFLLSQLEGMSKREDQFGALGVIGAEVEAAMGRVGAFLLKASEMLQAIEASMRDFHVFVRWVSGVHLRLLREHVPPDLGRMSQQETASLLAFLDDAFEEVVTGADGQRRTHFRLERAGQYLKKEELKTRPRADPTPFAQLVDANPALAAHRLIFVHNPRSSLIQEYHSLKEALTQMGARPGLSIGASVKVGACVPLARIVPRGPAYSVAQVASPEGSIMSAVVLAVRQPSLLVLEWPPIAPDHVRAASFVVSGGDGGAPPMGVLDAQFYSADTLSLLLLDPSDPRNPSFAQVSVQSLRAHLTSLPLPAHGAPTSDLDLTRLDLTHIPDALSLRRLETGLASAIAVSGPRKVAAVIGDNRRRVRIYEMEAEDDEEDDDDDTKNESLVNNSTGLAEELNDTL